MRVVKQIIAQQAEMLKEPKKKRRCEANCTEHQFVIFQSSKGPKNMDVSINFCPKYRRGDLPPENSFAEFNKDGIFYTSAFILGVDKRLSQKIQKEEQIEHIRIVRLACEKNCLVRFPKPNSKHSLCSVCKVTYGNYLKHILSQFHKQKINNCPYNQHIAELSKQFQHFHPQDLINVSSPFEISLKGQALPINIKKQTILSKQHIIQKTIAVKPQKKQQYEKQSTKCQKDNKGIKGAQNRNRKKIRIKQERGPSLTKNESSSSLSSDQTSSSSSDSSSSSSISSESNSKSSFSSDAYRRKNKSSHSSSSSSISSSSLSSSQSIDSLSSKNDLTLDKNSCQLNHKKQKGQVLEITMKKEKRKTKQNKKKQYKKNSLNNDAFIRQKTKHSIKNNQEKLLQGKKQKKSINKNLQKAIDPLAKVGKKRNKNNTDKIIISENQDKKIIKTMQQTNKQIFQSEKNAASENIERQQSYSVLKLQNQPSIINYKHLYDVEQVLRIPIQIDLPPEKQLNLSEPNKQDANSIRPPQHIQMQLITSTQKDIVPDISEQKMQKQEKFNISQKQSSVQDTIQIKELIKNKLKSKMTSLKRYHLNYQKEKKKDRSIQNIGLNLLQIENQQTNWMEDWKRASSFSLQAPLSKFFINNQREIDQHQLLIEVDDDDVQDKQINEQKQANHQNYNFSKKLNSQNGNRLSSKDVSNVRLSLQKLSNFLIDQYQKLKRVSTDCESLPEDVSTYLQNEFRLKND